MQVRGVTVDIFRGDITEVDAEAIVNPANGQLIMDEGLAGVIKKKGGVLIAEEAARQKPVLPGNAVVTSAGALKGKFVIHAVTVDANGHTNELILRSALASALRCAEERQWASVALPALGCGAGGFPVMGAAKITAQEILRFARFEARTVRRILLCLLADDVYQCFLKEVPGYIEHIQNHLGLGPYLTVDIIIEQPQGLVVIERTNPPYGLALPGGFVDYGESLETAARREAREETNLDLINLRQMHTFSEPGRDPRFHTVSTVFIAQGKGIPRAGDDAKGLRIVPYERLLAATYAFDHKEIIRIYLQNCRGKGDIN